MKRREPTGALIAALRQYAIAAQYRALASQRGDGYLDALTEADAAGWLKEAVRLLGLPPIDPGVRYEAMRTVPPEQV